MVFHLGRWRRPATFLVAVVSAALFGLPLASLIRRAGLSGSPELWSLPTVVHSLAVVGRAEMWVLFQSLLVAVLAGGMCAALALVVCWACLTTPWLRTAALVLMAVAWSLPGPIVGLGLKETIYGILQVADRPSESQTSVRSPKDTIDGVSPVTGSSRLATVLWHGPSPAPLVWVDLIRFFPFAMALLWPVVRQSPPELRDAARMDGATPGQELGRVTWPVFAGATLRAALVVGVLTLGELSAGKLVATPGWPGYAQTIFEQMHFGVRNDLAARCLWLLAAVGVGTAVVTVCGAREGR